MSSSALPTLSSSQVKQVDTLAEQRFGISTDWLMEAAGWQVARLCDERAVVVCGVGNNAGDGLAAARHLHRWGRLAAVCCVDAERLRGPAARERDALRLAGVGISDELTLEDAPVVIDAIFGTGLTRAPEGRFAEWIDDINAADRRVISVDVPSGLDADTGVAYAPTVNASTVITLGLPKRGLSRVAAEVILVDIGIPLEAYGELGLDVPPGLFAADDRVRL